MDVDSILEEVKSFINFTWEDSAKEKRVKDYIASSMAYLEEVSGYSIDFENDYLARELLFNRVLYMDSRALDDFQKNYNGMLQELQIKYSVQNDNQC